MSNPKITVLLPVYNGEKYIADTISSVLSQNYADFELLVINDGSTDKTVTIIESFADSRIRLVHNPGNIKLIATLNRGLELARGEYIARIDADDYCLPNRFHLQVNFLDQHPDYGMVGGGMRILRDKKSNMRLREASRGVETLRCLLLLRNAFNHPTVMMRRSVLEKYQLKYENFPHAEDYELWIRLLDRVPCDNLNEPLVIYRFHENQVSLKFNRAQVESTKIIHRRLLNQLGLKCTEDRINLHYHIFTQLPPASLEFAEAAAEHLEQILAANTQRKCYDQQVLKHVIGKEWFLICTSLATAGVPIHSLYMKSSLRRFADLNMDQRMRFWLKYFVRHKVQ